MLLWREILYIEIREYKFNKQKEKFNLKLMILFKNYHEELFQPFVTRVERK